MSAVFLSWYGVSSVVRWSSVTARWSHVVRFVSSPVSLDCPLSHGGMGSPFSIAVANRAVDCGSVGSSTAR